MVTFDYQALDEVIHSRIRLAIMSVLVGVDEAEFTFLRDQIGATDGNLNTHMKRLKQAGYVAEEKRFIDQKPNTRYRLTEQGRRAFEQYVAHLEHLLKPQ